MTLMLKYKPGTTIETVETVKLTVTVGSSDPLKNRMAVAEGVMNALIEQMSGQGIVSFDGKNEGYTTLICVEMEPES
ncbi:hypothetical protein [Synechococcus sp. PCC 6312]|uniref:hypothetical protein n=1 Tax=Synechococcus sp. (strain ATCC 27167 / PCC 6312) TaxID=195253 RepID=UPI00029EF196|nr:hypothetical protein [Synechococcus sp. PCC 6312]AFY61976.1 hypothetical protein Syn6312_2913 [Synechococcus sp. PCC 6312]